MNLNETGLITVLDGVEREASAMSAETVAMGYEWEQCGQFPSAKDCPYYQLIRDLMLHGY